MAKTKRGKMVEIPLTPEQMLEKRVAFLKDTRFVSEQVDLPTYSINVGDDVEIGNLKGVKVVKLFDEGRILGVSYYHMLTRDERIYFKGDYPQYDPNRLEYGAWYWFDTVPLADSKTSIARDYRHIQMINTGFDSLYKRHLTKELYDNPAYQRDYVWTESDKLRFIESIFEGSDLGKFILISKPWPEIRYEVLDGKQRISTAADYVAGKFPFKGYYWKDLSRTDRHLFSNRNIQYCEIPSKQFKESERLRLFLDVNVAGVPQTDEHLAKVRGLYERALANESAQQSQS